MQLDLKKQLNSKIKLKLNLNYKDILEKRLVFKNKINLETKSKSPDNQKHPIPNRIGSSPKKN